MKLSETYTPFSVVSPVDSSPQMYPSASLGVEATDCVKPTHPPSSDTPAERVCELLHSAGVHNCRLGKQRQRPTKKASLSYIISRHTHTHTHTHTQVRRQPSLPTTVPLRLFRSHKHSSSKSYKVEDNCAKNHMFHYVPYVPLFGATWWILQQIWRCRICPRKWSKKRQQNKFYMHPMNSFAVAVCLNKTRSRHVCRSSPQVCNYELVPSKCV